MRTNMGWQLYIYIYIIICDISIISIYGQQNSSSAAAVVSVARIEDRGDCHIPSTICCMCVFKGLVIVVHNSAQTKTTYEYINSQGMVVVIYEIPEVIPLLQMKVAFSSSSLHRVVYKVGLYIVCWCT